MLGQSQLELEESFVAPRTPAEEVIAEIWARALGLEKIGIHNNFFALGGTSLLTTQVISRARSIFRVELPLRNLFREPTVEGMVNVISQVWGDREIVEEIARTFKQVDQLSTAEVKYTLSAQE